MSALPPAWTAPATVESFSRSAANPMLLEYAARLPRGDRPARVLDIGCGAGRNAVPLARAGFHVMGTDLSVPMLQAAAARDAGGRLTLVRARMDALPVQHRSCDVIIAHGIWNLAQSDDEFRAALRDAARTAAATARLFVFTFSRRTLPPDAPALNGQRFTFTQFSGHPQIFLTATQLQRELADAGFVADPELPLRELNLPPDGRTRIGGAPVIYEGGFRFQGV